jgi:hypothetical protein
MELKDLTECVIPSRTNSVFLFRIVPSHTTPPRHLTATTSTRPGAKRRCSVRLPFSAVQLLNATAPCTCPCHSPLLPHSSYVGVQPYECTETLRPIRIHPHPFHSSTYPHPFSRHPSQSTMDYSFPHLPAVNYLKDILGKREKSVMFFLKSTCCVLKGHAPNRGAQLLHGVNALLH